MGGRERDRGASGHPGQTRTLLSIGLDEIRKKEQELAIYFYDEVRKLPGVKIYSEDPRKGAAIVTLNLGDEDSGVISDQLMRDYGIATRAGAHCAPLVHEMLGTVEQGAVRFSFSYHNSLEDAHSAVSALKSFL